MSKTPGNGDESERRSKRSFCQVGTDNPSDKRQVGKKWLARCNCRKTDRKGKKCDSLFTGHRFLH